MSKRWLLSLAVLLVLVLAAAAAGVVWYAQPQKVVVTIEVTGRRGLAVKGTADVDGVRQELTGSLPTRFVLEGYKVTYSLANTEDAGEIRAKAMIDDAALGSSTTGDPPKYGIRGWVQSSWWRSPPTDWIESYDLEKDEAWKRPPP
jgi:hypothetical protein